MKKLTVKEAKRLREEAGSMTTAELRKFGKLYFNIVWTSSALKKVMVKKLCQSLDDIIKAGVDITLHRLDLRSENSTQERWFYAGIPPHIKFLTYDGVSYRRSGGGASVERGAYDFWTGFVSEYHPAMVEVR